MFKKSINPPTATFRNNNRMQTRPTPPLFYQAPDPQTRELAKNYFKLIQATHHRKIIELAISTQTPPKGMLKHVAKLTTFIKPSSPTDAIRQALRQNTENWMNTNLEILREHYLDIIIQFSNLPYKDLPYNIACGWARKRYQARLAHSTLHTVRSMLDLDLEPSHISDSPLPSSQGSQMMGDTPPGVDLGDRQKSPPLPKPQLGSPPPPIPLSPIVHISNRTEAGARPLPLVRPQTYLPVPHRSSPLSPSPLPRSPPSSSSPPFSSPSPPSPEQPQKTQTRTRAQSPSFSSSEDDFVNLGPHKPPPPIHKANSSEKHSNRPNRGRKTDTNPLFIPAGHVGATGPSSAFRPGPKTKTSFPVRKEVVGNHMMSMRSFKQNHADPRLKKTSSDPTKTTTFQVLGSLPSPLPLSLSLHPPPPRHTHAR